VSMESPLEVEVNHNRRQKTSRREEDLLKKNIGSNTCCDGSASRVANHERHPKKNKKRENALYES